MTPSLEGVLSAAGDWADADPSIRAIALVGSYARGDPRAGSDVDLVVLSTAPERLLSDDSWFRWFGRFDRSGGVRLVRSEDFGDLQERRLLLASGLEVEIGIGAPSWASVDPVDPGTREVVLGGLRAVYDPDGLLDRLRRAVPG